MRVRARLVAALVLAGSIVAFGLRFEAVTCTYLWRKNGTDGSCSVGVSACACVYAMHGCIICLHSRTYTFVRIMHVHTVVLPLDVNLNGRSRLSIRVKLQRIDDLATE